MSDAAGPANPSSPSNPPGTGDRGSESRANAPKRGSEGRPAAARSFQAPKGTRDFYPADLLRRRYIIDTWRRVSLRHGFEEIDGPTFEDSDLYTVKSGEGILNELFGAYSGKDPNDTKQVQAGGPPPFALRPEFTPTLARMYAARARQLPQPTKWFCVSNFFRAERPQRGRLREFWQWNADVLGMGSLDEDAELIALLVECIQDVGLGPQDVQIHLNDRVLLEVILGACGVKDSAGGMTLVDQRGKLAPERFRALATTNGLDVLRFEGIEREIAAHMSDRGGGNAVRSRLLDLGLPEGVADESMQFCDTFLAIQDRTYGPWTRFDLNIARGLAYYTGVVFEAIAAGERAIAGGGFYGNLIHLFGGPGTAARGFGMGDVVLTNLLDDRKLMPEGKDLLEACSRPLPVRCDVFVVANEKDEAQAQVVPTVAALRRGVESDKYRRGGCKPWSLDRYDVAPLHARRSYKTTKNIGKLLGDATACHARFALIIEDAEKGTLKNLDTREEFKDVPLSDVGRRVAGGPGL